MTKVRPLATVGALIIAPDGDVLLVRSAKWNHLFSLPGGKVELGETREEALKREILEETGLVVTNAQFAIVQDCIFSPEFWQHKHFIMHDYIVKLDSSDQKACVQLNDEAQEFCWISLDQALKLNLHQQCRCLIEWYLKQDLGTYQGIQGTIGFCDYQILTIVGIHSHERVKEQNLIISGKVKQDFARCHQSEHIQDTIDYTVLTSLCLELAQKNHYQLIETYATDILKYWMNHLPISWASIKIEKPSAIAHAKCAFVELEMSRENIW